MRFIDSHAEAFPDATTTNGDDGIQPLDDKRSPWGFDYGRVTPLIVKAFQDFYAKWFADSQNTHRELSSVKDKVEKLEKENAELKSYLCSKDPSAPVCH